VLVGGAILPHPPIILPAYASERGEEVDATIDAVRAACRWIASELHPDRIVISSPHPGHGFAVPLHFVNEALGTPMPAQELLTTDPAYEAYRDLGEFLRRSDSGTLDRIVIIASGDCSHRLHPEGPYGFHPMGPKLDRAIVEGVRAASVSALLDIDPMVVDEGGECGLRSFIFGLAALHPSRCEVLSYQAPYGVGYLVALMHPGDGEAGPGGSVPLAV
jgi:aromatic ring-opening dioxygenase LigB subunit